MSAATHGRLRHQPSGPAAAAARAQGGVGRGSSRYAEQVSDDLRRIDTPDLARRRAATGLALLATAALGVVQAYQTGLLRRVPEPRLSWLNAGHVDASGSAYQLFGTPDAGLGIASYGASLVLYGAGPADRATTIPWLPLLAAAKAGSGRGQRHLPVPRTGHRAPQGMQLVHARGAGQRGHCPPGVAGGEARVADPAPPVSAGPDCPPQHRPSISAHRLVGNGRSALLLRPDAEIDWWCAPELDSAPVCWSLLDPGGGRAAFQGVRYTWCSAEPAGRTARTELATGRGRIEVRDGLVDGGDAGVTLARLVRAVDTGLDLQHELCLAGFGSDAGPDRWR